MSEQAKMQPPDHWIERPPFPLDDETLGHLEDVFTRDILPGENAWITGSRVPAWVFLCWLSDEKKLLLHGSGDPHIECFEPRTPDAKDDDEFSQQTAVFAASDGIWPMFYAILDRARFKLRMLNGCLRFELADGSLSNERYFFSVTDTVLEKHPWREGVIYVLSRDGFTQQPPYMLADWHVHDPHWANLNPVRPLARIRVQPEDFPFFEQVRGHDNAIVMARAARNPRGLPWLTD